MTDKKPPAGKPRRSGPQRKGSQDPMDVDLLQQIVDLMTANDLSAVAVRDGDKRIMIRRGPQQVTVAAPGYAPAAAGGHQGHAAGAAAPPAAQAKDVDQGLLAIKSPMVGTFYAAPSPEAKPFVAVGAEVDEETDVCIIEAMKVFNNIKAEVRGTVTKVLVSNGQSVEFGQTLFLVQPAAAAA